MPLWAWRLQGVRGPSLIVPLSASLIASLIACLFGLGGS